MSSASDDVVAALAAEVAGLRDRVQQLEQLDAKPARTATATHEDAFWALDGLRSRLTASVEPSTGAVLLTGTLKLPTGAPVEWQQAADTAGLLETSWEERAATFAALSHPVRLELLRQVLHGTNTTAELAELEDLGTTGQLHHHLRQLLATGWLRNSGRGKYEVPAARIVPLLVCMTAVER